MSEILISVLLLVGTVTTLLGSIGLIRFPDVYTRMHATDKGVTLGLLAITTAGTIFFVGEFGFTFRLLLVIPFLFVTAPAGSFMLARAAHRIGPNMATVTMRDDMQYEAGTRSERE